MNCVFLVFWSFCWFCVIRVELLTKTRFSDCGLSSRHHRYRLSSGLNKKAHYCLFLHCSEGSFTKRLKKHSFLQTPSDLLSLSF